MYTAVKEKAYLGMKQCQTAKKSGPLQYIFFGLCLVAGIRQAAKQLVNILAELFNFLEVL